MYYFLLVKVFNFALFTLLALYASDDVSTLINRRWRWFNARTTSVGWSIRGNHAQRQTAVTACFSSKQLLLLVFARLLLSGVIPLIVGWALSALPWLLTSSAYTDLTVEPEWSHPIQPARGHVKVTAKTTRSAVSMTPVGFPLVDFPRDI